MFTALVPLSLQRHAGRGWRRFTGYAFAAGTPLVPLVGAELAKALHAFPIAFQQQAKGFTPVAVLGLDPDRNLFVTEDGRWLGGYVPARLRGYPFVQAQSGDGRAVLCVDEDSGLLTDATAGEPVFADDGTLSAPMQAIAGFLTEVERSRLHTAAATAKLAESGLIVPWSLEVALVGTRRRVTGLYTVDEAALNGLSDAAFVALRRDGALRLAYAQLFSQAHISLLEQLADAHAKGDEQRRQRLADSFVDDTPEDLSFHFG